MLQTTSMVVVLALWSSIGSGSLIGKKDLWEEQEKLFTERWEQVKQELQLKQEPTEYLD